ncbi:hypothetical protein PLICRDRAFT_36971 [Plicaturopsis crispa FD-325 SS-3]|nr:hypothetical protein PLICRDRAFT_36971 [Plicaturopsis crispa FD-325 SS-3]
MSTAQAQASDVHSLLSTTPTPLISTLLLLAPLVASARHVADILTWRAPWAECWLALAAWWAFCMLGEFVLRYTLPISILFVLTVRRYSAPKRTGPPPPATEHTLENTIAHLDSLSSVLPSFSQPPFAATLTPSRLLRALTLLYLPYLILTHLVPLRILIALTGTIFLTWNASWASFLRRTLWRTAHVRWACYKLGSVLLALPPPHAPAQPPSILSVPAAAAPSTPAQGQTVRFLFTLYENQRWWMGLDWTAALLPGERPAWSSRAGHAVSPPSAFALPGPSTVRVPSSTATLSRGRKRQVRTARWAWEEPEWKVVGAGGERVVRPLPSADEPGTSASASGALMRAAGKMRASMDEHSRPADAARSDGAGAGDDGDDGVYHAGEDEEGDEEIETDADGWVYGGNKWEGLGPKGGIGKYTRYRRWTRIAYVTETIEEIDIDIDTSSAIHINVDNHDSRRNTMRESPHPSPTGLPSIKGSDDSSASSPVTEDTGSPSAGESTSKEGAASDGKDGGKEGLRQRLRALARGSTV